MDEMRSSLVVRASDSRCYSRNCPGHIGIWGAADEAVLNKFLKIPKNPPSKLGLPLLFDCWGLSLVGPTGTSQRLLLTPGGHPPHPSSNLDSLRGCLQFSSVFFVGHFETDHCHTILSPVSLTWNKTLTPPFPYQKVNSVHPVLLIARQFWLFLPPT